MAQTIPLLLVEDNPGDARLIRELLADAGETRFELTGTDRLLPALTLLHRQRFAVVLLDLMLPDSQGIATFQALRAETPRVPVVVLTGLGDETLALQAVSEGAQDYLVKGQVSGRRLVESLLYAISRDALHKQRDRALEMNEEEMGIARRIQQHLFPNKAPACEGFEIHGASFSASATGGDCFDYLDFGDGRVGVVIGDVTGHGVGPALLMAATRAYLRAFAQTQSDIGQVLALANRVLVHDCPDERMVTLLLALFDRRERSLTCANAGHPPGYVLDPAGVVRAELGSTGVPLGLMREGEFPTGPPLRLEDGEVVLLVTDGVLEARSPAGECFEKERALDIVRAHRDRPASQIVQAIYDGVCEFCGDQSPDDDITVIVIKVHPAGAAAEGR